MSIVFTHRWITRTNDRTSRRAALIGAVAFLATTFASAGGAQTLTAPNPPTRPAAPAVGARPGSSGAAKSCAMYGAGFVNVPGTDTCVKIGGFVTVEGTAASGR